MASNCRLTLFADYFQFVVMDHASEDDFSSIWTSEALEHMVAIGDSALSLGTLRNVEVGVEVHVVPELPQCRLEEYDHVVEGSFQAPTGTIAVMGCTDFLPDAHRMQIAPGGYQFLYLVSGVDSITDEWSPADDLYTLYLSPGPGRPAALLKHWRDKARPRRD